MGQNSYQVYINGCIDLAQTLVVKSEYCATTINERLAGFYGVETDEYDKHTWKYYMNLAGEYHPSDKIMKVISSDNLEEIVFNKQNLLRHKNTRRDYLFGTRQYNELLERFPDQEDLILGILYPTDIDKAIAAPDNTILNWPDYLIEANEYTLVEELQTWTTNYFASHLNMQYAISDDLYVGVVLANYRLILIAALVTFRKKRCKTNEAHSFHIREYLASHSNLGSTHKFMTIDQSLKFYRDIKYYQKRSGQEVNLGDLVEDLMTARALPIAEYTMKQSDETILETLDPVVSFKRKDMTYIPSVGVSEYTDLQGMLEKEMPEAHNNVEFVDDNEAAILEQLQTSPSATVMTKVMESATVDFANAVTYKLEDMLVNHWLYYSQLGLYTAVVNVPHPRTADRFILSALDAYILATYCMYRMMEQDPDEIPLLGAERCIRYPLISEADAEKITDMAYINDFTKAEAWRFARETEPMISIDSFYERVSELHKLANYQRDLVAFQEHMERRGQTFLYISSFWGDYYMRGAPEGTTYKEWLFARSINLDGMTRSEAELLWGSLVSKATGLTLSTTPSRRNVQAAMIRALKSLVSYSVQIVGKMSDDDIVSMEFPSLRVGDRDADAEGEYLIRYPIYTVLSRKGNGVTLKKLNVNILRDILDHTVDGEHYLYLDLSIGPRIPDRGLIYQRVMRFPAPSFGIVNPPDVSGTPLQAVLGQDIYMNLTPEQKAGYLLFDSSQ